MKYSRKTFLFQSASLLSLGAVQQLFPSEGTKWSSERFDDDLPTWQFPPLENSISRPVLIDTIELVKTQGQFFLIVKTKDGKKGITQCNERMQHLVSILKGLVIPHFLNQDARNITQLVDNAYRLNSNYKYSGMPLWNCIGTVEIAIWDLLGIVANKPTYQLLGSAVRDNYNVYISDFSREGDPSVIAGKLMEKLNATGAKGVKVKVGGRMVNTPENAAHTKRFIPLLRKTLGDRVIIYADANGSFTVKEGIETGKLLQDYGIEIFEEPCNFENEDATRLVTEAMKKLKIAGGEQDTSLYRFKRFAKNKVYHLLQPDLYYNGGIMRTLHVSAIAKKYEATGIAPHTPKADPLIGPFWQVASIIPNLYGLQEFVFDLPRKVSSWHSSIQVKEGTIEIPKTNGLGIQYDETIWNSAEKII